MKLSILASALMAASTATAVPTTLSSRADICWTQDIQDTTNPSTSPLSKDCSALALDSAVFSNLEPSGVWIPSEENNFAFDISNGSCGFKGTFNRNGGSLPANQMTVSQGLVANALGYSVEYLAANGTVSATGNFACLIAGWKSQTGWVRWEIYNAATSR